MADRYISISLAHSDFSLIRGMRLCIFADIVENLGGWSYVEK